MVDTEVFFAPDSPPASSIPPLIFLSCSVWFWSECRSFWAGGAPRSESECAKQIPPLNPPLLCACCHSAGAHKRQARMQSTGNPPGHSEKVSTQPCQSRKWRYFYTGLSGCYRSAAAPRTNHRVTNQGNCALLVF